MSGLSKRGAIFALAIFTVGITAIRLWYATNLGLAPDEAYYWTWSLDPSLHYHDHPPLLAWLIRGGTWLAPAGALGVRLSSVLLGAAVVPVIYLVAKTADLDTPRAAICAAFVNLLPMPATGAIMATPDAPLALCWSVAILSLAKLARHGSNINWYILGAATGAGLLAKHSAALIPITTLFLLWIFPSIRARIRTVHPWLAAGLAGLIALPYFYAEASAGFPSIGHQISHLSGGLRGSSTSIAGFPLRLSDLLAGQFGLLTPLVAILAGAQLSRYRKLDPAHRIILAGLFIPILATLAAAVFTHPEQNWASLGHPMAAIAVASTIRKRRVLMAATVGLAAVLTVVIHIHATRPFLPLPSMKDPVSRLHGWNDLLSKLPDTNGVDAIVCDNYGLAAQARWDARDDSIDIPIVSTDRPHIVSSGKWIILDQVGEWGDAKPKTMCDRIEFLEDIILRRYDGEPVRTIRVSVGQNCR